MHECVTVYICACHLYNCVATKALLGKLLVNSYIDECRRSLMMKEGYGQTNQPLFLPLMIHNACYWAIIINQRYTPPMFRRVCAPSN